ASGHGRRPVHVTHVRGGDVALGGDDGTGGRRVDRAAAQGAEVDAVVQRPLRGTEAAPERRGGRAHPGRWRAGGRRGPGTGDVGVRHVPAVAQPVPRGG